MLLGEHEKVKGVSLAHIVRLRKSGPIFQGEMEIEVSEEMTIKEFNEIKKKIRSHIKEIFPEIERVTITAMSNDNVQKNK